MSTEKETGNEIVLSRAEAVEARRAARRAELERQREDQLGEDLEALEALEIEHGEARVVRVNVERFTPGLPTLVVMLSPDAAQLKRYSDMCRATKDGAKGDVIKAANLLGDSLVRYPDKDLYARMREAYPGLHVVAAIAAANRAGGNVADDAKS